MNKLKKIKVVEKPWGREKWFAWVPNKYLAKILEINPNQQVSLHKHKDKEETFYIAQGSMILSTNGDHKIYGVGQFVHILPKQEHSMKAFEGGVVLFEASTCHPNDSIRIKDSYGRECDETQ